MSDEDDVRKFAEDYIKAMKKGDSDWILENADLEGMWEHNKEQVGESYEETPEEFAENFKSGVYVWKHKHKEKFTILSISIDGDRAEVMIDKEGTKEIACPLMLRKKSGKWKFIMGAVWF